MKYDLSGFDDVAWLVENEALWVGKYGPRDYLPEKRWFTTLVRKAQEAGHLSRCDSDFEKVSWFCSRAWMAHNAMVAPRISSEPSAACGHTRRKGWAAGGGDGWVQVCLDCGMAEGGSACGRRDGGHCEFNVHEDSTCDSCVHCGNPLVDK